MVQDYPQGKVVSFFFSPVLSWARNTDIAIVGCHLLAFRFGENPSRCLIGSYVEGMSTPTPAEIGATFCGRTVLGTPRLIRELNYACNTVGRRN